MGDDDGAIMATRSKYVHVLSSLLLFFFSDFVGINRSPTDGDGDLGFRIWVMETKMGRALLQFSNFANGESRWDWDKVLGMMG